MTTFTLSFSDHALGTFIIAICLVASLYGFASYREMIDLARFNHMTFWEVARRGAVIWYLVSLCGLFALGIRLVIA